MTHWLLFIGYTLVPGGVIEACPPSDSVTGLTANVLIEPDGNIEILSVSDQVRKFGSIKLQVSYIFLVKNFNWLTLEIHRQLLQICPLL